MKKKLAFLLALCMLTGAFAGCSSGGDTTTDTTDSNDTADTTTQGETTDQEPVTLTILAGQSTTDAGIEDMIDAAMAEKYPHITLEWECVDWGNDFQAQDAAVYAVRPARHYDRQGPGRADLRPAGPAG